MADMTVANTILAQLGGRKFVAMTGASSFVGGNDTLTFRLPRSDYNKKRIKGVRITLTPDDLYTMIFFKQKGRPTFEVVEVAKHEGIYADQLAEIFTSETGLYTHL
jgi:hypothetical protein